METTAYLRDVTATQLKDARLLARRVFFFFKSLSRKLSGWRRGWDGAIVDGRRSERAHEYLARFKTECVESVYKEAQALRLEWLRIVPPSMDEFILLSAAEKPPVLIAGESYETVFRGYGLVLQELAEGWAGGWTAFSIDGQFPLPGWESGSVEAWCQRLSAISDSSQQLARIEQEWALASRLLNVSPAPIETAQNAWTELFVRQATEFRFLATSTGIGANELAPTCTRAGSLLWRAWSAGVIPLPSDFPWQQTDSDPKNRELAAFAQDADWRLFVEVVDTLAVDDLPANVNLLRSRPIPTGGKLTLAETDGRDWRQRALNYSRVCEWISGWVGASPGLALSKSASANGQTTPNDTAETVSAGDAEIPDGPVGVNSLDVLVTVAMVAKMAHLATKSMSKYTKAWGEPAVPHSGRRAARYRLATILPILEKQFPVVKEWSFDANS